MSPIDHSFIAAIEGEYILYLERDFRIVLCLFKLSSIILVFVLILKTYSSFGKWI